MTQKIYLSEALVSDKFGYTESIIGETSDGPIKALILEGEFQRANTPNKNSRIYSTSLLRRETNKLSSFIEERNGLPMGMDHPLPGDTIQALTLINRMSMDRTCAMCKYLEMKGDIVYGKAQVIEGDHGAGDKLAAMLRTGFRPGVSSRGVGSPTPTNIGGMIYVPDDFSMVTYDIVSQPSVYNSVLSLQINEEYNALNATHKTFYDVLVDFTNGKINK